ncbi:MAG: DUF6762 family protein [Lachnospirales bacterium]
MEETVIVIMLKEKETGFFCKEICSIAVGDFEVYIQNINAQYFDNDIMLNMLVTTNRDVEDWEFDAILDSYESSAVTQNENVISMGEVEDSYNPTWSIIIKYNENMNEEQIEKMINEIIELHVKELEETYIAIKDLET